jgi:hypothetical protein
MKYTKEQLQGMNDFERNKTLAKMLGLKIAVSQPSKVSVSIIVNGACSTFNFKNPNDIMPLAFEHKIGVQHFNRGTWQAHSQGDEVIHDQNPLRAIACCLILVLQEKQL